MNRSEFKPAYIDLYESGELERRVEAAVSSLASCKVCPRDCKVDRLNDKTAVCKTGRYAQVSSHFAHFGEEDCLRGSRGSGTIFFNMCNLRCVFCQNYDISQANKGPEVKPRELASMMLELQDQGCHNINFVTPEHVVPQVLEAIPSAVEMGLRLPIVYNTSAYDSLESLKWLDGVVDIYMPDFKYMDSELAFTYLKARDYPQKAREALKEMHRQVGDLVLDENGLALRGLMVRHLVMPEALDDTREILNFIAGEISTDTYVNIMSQYYPAGKVSADTYPELNRHITSEEYTSAREMASEAGLWRLDTRDRSRRFVF